MKPTINVIKMLCIVSLCFLLNSSNLTYLSSTPNENYNKNINFSTIESEQYATYLDSMQKPKAVFTSELTGYGPDCKGCSGVVACKPNPNVKKTGIYFDDKQYGLVRMVASSSKYPCGTILKFDIQKLSSQPIIAVVMDRGGAIKDNRLDLLTETESFSLKYVGRIKNLEVEILRKGW